MAVEMERSGMDWRNMWEGEEVGLSYLDINWGGEPGVPGIQAWVGLWLI